MRDQKAPSGRRKGRLRPQSRRSQLGATYGVIDGLVILGAGVALLLLMLLLWGYAIAIAMSRGVVRWGVIPLLTAAWVIPLWLWLADGTADREARRARSNRHMSAMAACKAELGGLPSSVVARGLEDEGNGLTVEAWRLLLGQRGLDFVETRVDETRQVYVNGRWARLARVTLSRDGDSSCVSPGSAWTNEVHSGDRFRLPPFLPDTCVAISYPEKPSAPVVMKLTGHDSGQGEFHHWQLVERATRRVLAELPTSADGDDDLIVPDEGTKHGCSPRNELARLMVGAEGAPRPQLLEMRTIKVDTAPHLLRPERHVEAVLHAEVVGKDEYSALYDAPQDLNAWKAAVALARAEGYAGYGPWRVEWSARRMERLTFEQEATTHGAQVFHAVRGGYFMWSYWEPEKRDPVLAFYRVNGQLAWAVTIQASPSSDAADCRWDNPVAVSTGDGSLTLFGRGWCGSRKQKLTWTIDQRRLPR